MEKRSCVNCNHLGVCSVCQNFLSIIIDFIDTSPDVCGFRYNLRGLSLEMIASNCNLYLEDKK